METEFWWRQGPVMINVEAASANKYTSAKYVAVILLIIEIRRFLVRTLITPKGIKCDYRKCISKTQINHQNSSSWHYASVNSLSKYSCWPPMRMRLEKKTSHILFMASACNKLAGQQIYMHSSSLLVLSFICVHMLTWLEPKNPIFSSRETLQQNSVRCPEEP